MRSEKEMMELILRVAEKDQRVRAVAMNGSRTNSNVPKDLSETLILFILYLTYNRF